MAGSFPGGLLCPPAFLRVVPASEHATTAGHKSKYNGCKPKCRVKPFILNSRPFEHHALHPSPLVLHLLCVEIFQKCLRRSSGLQTVSCSSRMSLVTSLSLTFSSAANQLVMPGSLPGSHRGMTTDLLDIPIASFFTHSLKVTDVILSNFSYPHRRQYRSFLQ